MPYINRIVDAELERALGAFGAVLLEGPKWCGKTTTAARVARSSLMLSDPAGDFASRKLAQVEPSVAIEGESPRLIDEWQEVPKLWDAVRYRCDATGGRGLFVLTGSATPDDAHAPMHSGVGRIARVRMGTLTLQEQGISIAGLLQGKSYTALGSLDVQAIAQLVVRGGWPSAAGVPAPAASMLARGYVDGICNSDVSRIDGVRRDPDKVTRLVRSLARNESTLGTSAGTSRGRQPQSTSLSCRASTSCRTSPRGTRRSGPRWCSARRPSTTSRTPPSRPPRLVQARNPC